MRLKEKNFMKINDYLIKAAQAFNSQYNFQMRFIKLKTLHENDITIEVGYAAINKKTKKMEFVYNLNN